MVKGIGLISGGLDSILAVEILRDQGIDIKGISFRSPFFSSDRAEKAAKMLNVELIVMDIFDIHFEIVRSPKFGYGRGMNPCIDCHALMFREAGKIMEAEGADFLFSGEVLDERPMSQNFRSLMRVSNESGYRDYIIRPLSAKLLPRTLSEREGNVNREGLLNIRGRSRKRQIELAKHYGIIQYPQPAGGCLLTESAYSRKLKELIDNGAAFELRDIELLTIGRHFRLDTGDKLIIGRDENDNEKLLSSRTDSDTTLSVNGYPGPVAIITNILSEESIAQAAAICASYSDAPQDDAVEVEYYWKGNKYSISTKAMEREDAGKTRI